MACSVEKNANAVGAVDLPQIICQHNPIMATCGKKLSLHFVCEIRSKNKNFFWHKSEQNFKISDEIIFSNISTDIFLQPYDVKLL